MNLTPIRELVKKTRHIDPKKLGVESFTYVDISSVDKDTKKITVPQILSVCDAPSRARKEIKANDVLVATVRPNLNGVAIVPPQYDNQIASTGFCVLRADTEQLDPNYLFYFTQTGNFVSHLTDLSTGAGYPAVSDEDILDTQIPLPPLTEQKRIASLLRRADRLRQLRRTAHDLGDALLQSVFLEMFGDPVRNERGFDVYAFEELSQRVTKGESPNWQGFSYEDSGVLFITSENVLWGTLDISSPQYISEKFHNKLRRSQLLKNDLLINLVGASIGRAALVTDDAIPANINQAVAVVTINTKKLNPLFALTQILAPEKQKQLLGNVVESARANISLTNISELNMIVPPLSLQEEFAGVVARVESLRGRMGESTRQVEGLFESVLSEAFQ